MYVHHNCRDYMRNEQVDTGWRGLLLFPKTFDHNVNMFFPTSTEIHMAMLASPRNHVSSNIRFEFKVLRS